MSVKTNVESQLKLANEMNDPEKYAERRLAMRNAEADIDVRKANALAPLKREMEGTFAQKSDLTRETQGTFGQNSDLKREMQGTFGQNADLKRGIQATDINANREMHGTFDQNAALKTGMQRDDINAANYRTHYAGGIDMQKANMQYGPDSILARRTDADIGPGGFETRKIDIMKQGADTASAAQQATERASGYDSTTNSLTGETSYTRFGQPIAPAQGAAVKSDWSKFNAKADTPVLYERYAAMKPEEQSAFLNDLAVQPGGAAVLKAMKSHRQTAGAPGGAQTAAAPAVQPAPVAAVPAPVVQPAPAPLVDTGIPLEPAATYLPDLDPTGMGDIPVRRMSGSTMPDMALTRNLAKRKRLDRNSTFTGLGSGL